MKRLAVFGRPVGHSLGPLMHGSLADHYGIPLVYLRVRAESPERIIPLAELLKLDGFNVTAPFKAAILPHLSNIDARAKRLGAVNTVLRTKNGWQGFNTDPDGVIHALLANGFQPKGQQALVVGAGGAAAAAVLACQDLGLKVKLVNRTWERGQAMATRMGIVDAPWSKRTALCADTELLILAAAIDEVETCLDGLPPKAWVLQADYRSGFSPEAMGSAKGLKQIDGLDWLMGQGTAAFQVFTDQEVDKTGLEAARHQIRTPQARFGSGHLCLMGLPGCGKTSLAKALSERWQQPAVDLDEMVACKQGLSVSEIFSRFGEAFFRDQESAALHSVLDGPATLVSLGGGVVKKSQNRGLLANEHGVIWLAVSAELATERARKQGGRPLLGQGDYLGPMRTLLQQREAHYTALADLVLDGELPLENLVEGMNEEVR